MKTLITAALQYVSGIKHLGNLVGSMLPADVYAKYLRQQGEDVLYVCGTDEHGTPAELAAQKAGQPVADFCGEMFETQKAIYEQFGIEFDAFGRTSSDNNKKLTQDVYLKLKENGFIEIRDLAQVYSNADGRFLPDRYVEGTCPKCGYEKARGDQCDGCGALLDPTDLIKPHSVISGSEDLEVRHSKHAFLKLDSLQPQVARWIEQHDDWPQVTKGIAKKWLQEGLQPRCISRDLDWGIPIPDDELEGKVFYVWFDAPNGYVSITQDHFEAEGEPEQWRNWWQSNNDTRYVQFMAKDNVPFHAVFWPAMLMGTQEDWQQVDFLKAFNWLNYDGGKFSTSQGRGVFTDQALELFPADYWRYYLIANAPESSDADFTFEHFANTINKDCADVLGNFVNRVMALVNKYFDAKVPAVELPVSDELTEQASKLANEYDQHLRAMEFRKAAQTLREAWVLGNEYITREEPWKLAKTDLDAAGRVLHRCLHLIRLYAAMSAAIMPFTAQTIWGCFADDDVKTIPLSDALNFAALPVGHELVIKRNLFAKVEPEQVEQLTAQYAGG